MVALKPPPKLDRVWVLPGGLAATIHADRSGATLTGPLVVYRKVPITRDKCAEIFRRWRREDPDKKFLRGHDHGRQLR